jgi:hypothetical protein
MHGLPVTQPPTIPRAQRERWAQMLASLVPEATCLTCGGPAPRDGMHLCKSCARAKDENDDFSLGMR